MSLFMLVVILVYSVPHLALYIRVRRVLPPIPGVRIAALLAIQAFMVAFFVGFNLFRAGHPAASVVLPVAFIWMALVFWSFCAGLVLDVWNLLARLAPARVRPLKPGRQLAVIGVLCAAALAWGAVEARTLQVREITLESGARLEAPIRIVHITDVHLTPHAPGGAARRLTAKLHELKPDLLLCTGDYIDAPVAGIEDDLRLFDAVRPPLGKYAVLGNHEYYTGLHEALEAHRIAGFELLRGARATPVPGLVLAGVDDRDGERYAFPCFRDEAAALPENGPTNPYVILLKHRPDVTDIAAARADLQLSGHTHGGQIFPFGLFIRLIHNRLEGWHRMSPRLLLHVSRGVGFWGPPLRFLTPPELTLITLVPGAPESP